MRFLYYRLYVKHWLAKCYEIDIKHTDRINKHHQHHEQLQIHPKKVCFIILFFLKL